MNIGNEEVASTFEAGWDFWGYVVAAAIPVIALTWILLCAKVFEWIESLSYCRTRTREKVASIAWVIVTLASVAALLFMPGIIMRHIEHHESVAWVVGAGVVGVVALSIWAFFPESDAGLVRWIPAGSLGIGVVVGAFIDALNRAAASFPMGAGTFLLVLVAGGIFAFFWLSPSSRR